MRVRAVRELESLKAFKDVRVPQESDPRNTMLARANSNLTFSLHRKTDLSLPRR
jgi:hypothetical protein